MGFVRLDKLKLETIYINDDMIERVAVVIDELIRIR